LNGSTDSAAKPPEQSTSVLSRGAKLDNDKPRVDLVDGEWLLGVADILTFGAKKYEVNNWRKGISWSRVISAAFRHLIAIARGEDYDAETGKPHAWHLSCCAMFLSWYLKNRPEFDDRYKTISV